jgi:asparagine synthase (glutamine-hydrolysing)
MRDRLGRRPLFYSQGTDYLLFASELKALLASGLVPKRLDLHSVDRYLTLRCVPGPETMVHGVYHVPPGHVIEFCENRLLDTQVWDFGLSPGKIPKESAADKIRELLEQAVRRTPSSYVLWSAGIDCAALAAVSPEARPLLVGLDRSWQDETRLAKESARRMHRPLEQCPARRLTEEGFHRAVAYLDEPIADASVFPMWMIAEAASELASAFITGHGADELLGGYARYHFLERAKGAHRFVPTGLVSELMPALPPNVFVRRAGQSLATIRDTQESYLSMVSVFDRGERDALYTQAMKSALFELGEIAPPLRQTFTRPDLTSNVLALDLHVGIPNLLLTKCDRVAAAHGITLHHPYLDDDLVDFALRIPPDIKFGVRSKPLLRLAMKGLLPASIRQRARRGFRIPQNGRALRVIENVASETITPERVDASGLFRWHTVDAIVRAANHNVYRRRQFWAILMFFAWYRNVMEN